MADRLLDIDVDANPVIRALERLGASAEKHVLAASLETGRAIRTEAQRRMPRSAEPRWGSHLADHIQVKEYRDDNGRLAVLVYVADQTGRHPTNLDAWIEFGTGTMDARPYLLPAAALEEGAHLRRLEEALQAACDEADRG